MSEDLAEQVQQWADLASAEHRADQVSAFYLRLRKNKIPPRLAADWTLWEFWPDGGYEQDD